MGTKFEGWVGGELNAEGGGGQVGGAKCIREGGVRRLFHIYKLTRKSL